MANIGHWVPLRDATWRKTSGKYLLIFEDEVLSIDKGKRLQHSLFTEVLPFQCDKLNNSSSGAGRQWSDVSDRVPPGHLGVVSVLVWGRECTWWEHSWVDSCGHWVLAWTEQTYNQLDKLLNLSLTTWSDSLLKLYHSYGTRQNFQTFPRTGLICPELQRSLFLLTLALLDLWEVLLERGNTQGRRSRGSWTSPRTGPAGRCWEFLMSGVLTPRGLRTRDRPPGGWWRQDSLIEKQRALERPHKGLDNSLGWACVL